MPWEDALAYRPGRLAMGKVTLGHFTKAFIYLLGRALQHAESKLLTRDQTRAGCFENMRLNRWTTREAPSLFWNTFR